MNDSALPYFHQAFRILKLYHQLVLVPLLVGLVAHIFSMMPGKGMYTLSMIVRFSILAIIPVIYGRVNEIVSISDFRSWKFLFVKFFFKYAGFLLTVLLVMAVPVIILNTLAILEILRLNMNHTFTVASMLYHLIALYVVPLLFYETTIKDSIILGIKCLIGNIKFNLPIVLVALALSMLSRTMIHGELSILSASLNYLRWCVWFVANFIIFTAISLILWDKIYKER